MVLLLMAAGSGSRYGKLKQFDDLGPKGEFLMEFSIYDALENGFDHIVVVTKQENVEFLHDHLSTRLPKGIGLDVIAQEITDLPEGSKFTGERIKPWGTAHAVWSARNLISTPFVVINADDYYGKLAFKKTADFLNNNMEGNAYALVGYTLKDTLSAHGSVSRGVCKMEGNILLSVKEHTKLEQQGLIVKDFDSGTEFTGDELVSMNFWICRPSIFKHIEKDLRTFIANADNIAKGEIYLPFVIEEMVQQRQTQVEVLQSDGNWFGVTYASDKEKAMQQLKTMTKSGKYTSPLW
ncbi:NDP-sugar synthase [Spongiimicrobium sp. 3-5]|uniref:nucleotidyltransferase family protein n=1 Tax=Spongiimicrobium sp. 3-5 TaxID=3332596 RepID=UPI00397ED85F